MLSKVSSFQKNFYTIFFGELMQAKNLLKAIAGLNNSQGYAFAFMPFLNNRRLY